MMSWKVNGELDGQWLPVSFYHIFLTFFERTQQFLSFRIALGFQNGIDAGFQVPIKFTFLSDCIWELNPDTRENKDSIWLVHTFQSVLGRACLERYYAE